MGVEPGFDGGEVGEDGAAVEEGAGGVAEVEGVVFPMGVLERKEGGEGMMVVGGRGEGGRTCGIGPGGDGHRGSVGL